MFHLILAVNECMLDPVASTSEDSYVWPIKNVCFLRPLPLCFLFLFRWRPCFDTPWNKSTCIWGAFENASLQFVSCWNVGFARACFATCLFRCFYLIACFCSNIWLFMKMEDDFMIKILMGKFVRVHDKNAPNRKYRNFGKKTSTVPRNKKYRNRDPMISNKT